MDENKNTQNSAIGIPTGIFHSATQNSRSTELLNKMYDHLDTIDVSKLSWIEKKDFLEVVQKGRFLETAGQGFPYGFGGLSYCATPFNGLGKPAETSGDGADKAE